MRRFLRLNPAPRLLLVPLALSLMWMASACNLDYVGLPTIEAVVSGAPVVTIASPLPDAVFAPGVEVILQARVSNAGADITQVEARIDAEPVLTLDDPNPTGAYAFSIQETWTAEGAGPHTLAVTATRADGTSSEPVSVVFIVSGEAASASPTATGPTATVGVPILPVNTTAPATAAPTRTQAPATTAAPTASGGAAPIATFSQTLNVRSGPGLAFNPPIGSFSAGQTAEVVARNEAGDWLKVRYFDGEGWVFAELAIITGDVNSLPVDPGPAPPAAAQAAATLPLPATPAPQTSANLAAGLVVLDPAQPQCGQPFTVGLDVANLGSEATAAGGTVRLADTLDSDGSIQRETTGTFPVLAPGETFRVDMPLTVSTWYGETHRITLTIDAGQQVPESSDSDNGQELTYVLQRAACP